MENQSIVWLASYPRSGNTLLRTILWHCFGLRSASVYPKDLGGNKELEEYVGHIEHGPNKRIMFPKGAIPLVKTHSLCKDNNPAIYVIRDGRAACVSLWKFYDKCLPLEAFVKGQHRFGSWSDHVHSWNPWGRPYTLLLKYEDMTANMPKVLNDISNFLKKEIINENIPGRNTIVGVDGKWVKKKSNWTSDLKDDLLRTFNEENSKTLLKANYID